MQAFGKWKNPDGTYNGAAMFAELTGLPQAEIEWMGRRLPELMAKHPKQEAKRILAEEAKRQPWLNT